MATLRRGGAALSAQDQADIRRDIGLGTAATAAATDFAAAAQGTDAREWTAATVDQAEAEAGTVTTRRAWTAQRVRQAIVAWWNGYSSAAGRTLVTAADAAAQRTAIGAAGFTPAQTTAGGTAVAALTSGGVLLDASGAAVLTKSGTATALPGPVSVTGGTVTSNTPAFAISQTWNGAGQSFDGLQVAITNTASGTSAFPVNVLVNGSSIFSLRRDGYLAMQSGVAGAVFGLCGVNEGGPGAFRSLSNSGYYSIGAAVDVVIARGGPGILDQRNGTAAQTSRVFGTFTDASNGRWLNITMSTAGVAAITPTGNGTGATGNVLHISGLPTSNPGPGILWNDAGTVKVGT